MTRHSGATATRDPEPWLQLLRRRLRERDFWIVQLLVFAVTAIHIGVEATDVQHHVSLGGLVQLPVVLHIIPVVYAGFRYGYEGSVLTGLWSAFLAIPNIVFWHSEGFGWLGDLAFIAFVIGLGVLIAVPVERERRQRRRTESARQRLETLNGITAELSAMTDPEHATHRALTHLTSDLPIDRAGLRFLTSDELGPGATTIVPDRSMPELDPDELERDPRWVVVPLDEQRNGDVLAVRLQAGTELDVEDRELLVTAARHIGSALEASRLRLREQERLRTYAREVTRAQERERARIARDLHDVVAQDLTLLGRRLDQLDDGIGEPQEVRELTDDILDTVRRVSRGLRPPALEDLGLVPALKALAGDLEDRTRIETSVRTAGEARRLSGEVELALYRIVQEALHNAERHAEPDEVTVTVEFTPETVTITVADDGTGLDLDALTSTPAGLGLLGMRERAKLAGGELDISSALGKGTRVRAHVTA
ncbi:MAG: sensor histidine kinase [Nitriliruptorales bacterium]|nr:sensor histidine kinase [Nitriliruptorales bacterium]